MKYLIIALTVGLMACKSNEPSLSTSVVWIDPIQCNHNPWEVAWVEANQGAAYPTGDPIILEKEEQEIILNYYKTQNLEVRGLSWKDLKKLLGDFFACESCECPRGYRLYLSVLTVELETWYSLGFQLQTAADE